MSKQIALSTNQLGVVAMSKENLALDVPVMSQEKFAEKVGVTADTIRGMVDTKALDTVKIGKRRWINLAALTQKCLEGISNTAK